MGQNRYSLKIFVYLCCITLLGFDSNKSVHVFLIGDSTMADKPLVDNPEHGWGQMLPMFFSQNVLVRNYAVNGRKYQKLYFRRKMEKSI